MPPSDYDTQDQEPGSETAQRRHRSREKLRVSLQAGELDDRMVDLTIEQKPVPMGMFATIGAEQMDSELQSFLEKLVPSREKTRRVTVTEAQRILFEQACDKLIDREKVTEMAIRRTENSGIVFVDEIDKVGSSGGYGPDVSRQGVQRDLLPVVEGCTVGTRYGPVRTDHILFIAAGAFHTSTPNDLMPELQGRFPIRVELQDLTRDDFKRILTEPENALVKQQVALMATEGVKVTFLDEAVEAMADIANRLNESGQSIGARRLYTVTEKLMEELSFAAPERSGETLTIDDSYVRERLGGIVRNEELGRFGFHSLKDAGS
jgi:ATP-dependent HslUV protease ATP-binding subunit HslU